MKIYHKSHSVTGIFKEISPQMLNNDIEKCILMAASQDKLVSEILLNGCFSKTAAKIYSNGYIFYISYFCFYGFF